MSPFPYWVWFALARKLWRGELYRTCRHGAPDTSKSPYRFGDLIYVPQTYSDAGPWALRPERITSDEPNDFRSRLWVWFQDQGYVGRKWGFRCPRHWFPLGCGFDWRYSQLRSRFNLSADDARLVISIEEGKEMGSSALKMRIVREREEMQRILAAASGDTPWLREWSDLVRMFGGAGKVIRLPQEFHPDGPWPASIQHLAGQLNKLGKTYRIPKTPPRNVTVLEPKSALIA